jgi:hypothetical protein
VRRRSGVITNARRSTQQPLVLNSSAKPPNPNMKIGVRTEERFRERE